MYCTKCGANVDENSKFCQSCGTALQNDFLQQNTAPAQKETGFLAGFKSVFTYLNGKRTLAGVIGAATGATLGLLIWCIIAKLGYVSALGGLAIAAGGFLGYRIFGKTFSKKGVAIVVAMVLITVFFGIGFSYAISIHKTILDETKNGSIFLWLALDYVGLDTDASSGEIFVKLGDYLEVFDLESDYLKDLILSYLYTILENALFVGLIIIKGRKSRK